MGNIRTTMGVGVWNATTTLGVAADEKTEENIPKCSAIRR